MRYYGFEPKQDSGNRHKMRCPLHNEDTASFVIYPSNSYYCFGCSSGGGVVSFIMAHEKKSFDEVIAMFSGDVDVESNKFFTESIIKKLNKNELDVERYKRDSQYQLGVYLRDILYSKPEKKELVLSLYKEMDVFFNNESIVDAKYVDEFVDHAIERVIA
jgi:DNA primase